MQKAGFLNDAAHICQRVPKFSDRWVMVNSADPDQSDPGIHCLQYLLHLLEAGLFGTTFLFRKFKKIMVLVFVS